MKIILIMKIIKKIIIIKIRNRRTISSMERVAMTRGMISKIGILGRRL